MRSVQASVEKSVNTATAFARSAATSPLLLSTLANHYPQVRGLVPSTSGKKDVGIPYFYILTYGFYRYFILGSIDIRRSVE